MIDDTNYADCLALYNFDHVEKHSIKGMMLPISMSDYSLVIAPIVADLCTTPVALSAPPNSYQNNSQS